MCRKALWQLRQGEGEDCVKGQGAAGVIGQITGQGANVQGSITGQGAIVPGMSSGQGAISSRGTVHGQGDAKNAGMPVGKNSFLEKTKADRKRHEQMEHGGGGGDEVYIADLSNDNCRATTKK